MGRKGVDEEGTIKCTLQCYFCSHLNGVHTCQYVGPDYKLKMHVGQVMVAIVKS